MQTPSLPPTNAHLARLYEAEATMRSRAARVGARLELPTGAMWLLQLASHADAALDDLAGLAERGDGAWPQGASAARVWGRGAIAWLGDLLPSDAAGVYRSIAADLRRDIDLASDLRASAIAHGDLRLACWCALWIDQRLRLVEGLAASVAEVTAAPAGALSETAVR